MVWLVTLMQSDCKWLTVSWRKKVSTQLHVHYLKVSNSGPWAKFGPPCNYIGPWDHIKYVLELSHHYIEL